MANKEDCFNLKDLRDHLNKFPDEVLEGAIVLINIEGEEYLLMAMGKFEDGSPNLVFESI